MGSTSYPLDWLLSGYDEVLLVTHTGRSGLSALQHHLLEHPKAGPIIRGSGVVRKLRWNLRGKGKSGGVRVIYYIPDGGSFWMLTTYGKGDVDSIPGPMLKKIKEAMDDR